MAPSKKSKYKKTSRVNVVSPNKDEADMSKTRQRKRKLSDMLGPQWSKEELERFYDAYRKFGKEWKKVAVFVQSRSVEMVEALYTMNKAYLSLPEGSASVVGLIAMMTDHYSVLHGGSDSEQESNEGTDTRRKAKKRSRIKSSDHPSKGPEGLSDRLQFRSSGCMSLLKKRRTEIVPRAVGKRTPRIPISFSHEKDNREKYLSPVKRGLKQKGDVIDDDMEHEIALTLAEALQRGSSPLVSRTPSRKAEMISPHKKDEKMRAEIDLSITKLHSSEMDEGGCELSLGSTEADNGDYTGPRNHLMHGEGSSAVELQQKGKRYYRKKLDIEESSNNRTDDVKEACSGTEEGQHLGPSEEKFKQKGVVENSAKLTYKGSRRKSKKVLFTADEGAACDALQTLADLSSLMMSDAATDTESSVQVKEERARKTDETNLKGSDPAPGSKIGSLKTSKQRKFITDNLSNAEAERKIPSSSVMRKRKQKSSPVKVPKDEAPPSSQFAESPKSKGTNEGKKPVSRGKLSTNIPNSHEKKSIKHHDHASTSNEIIEGDGSTPSTAQANKKQVNLPTKIRSRRKTTEKLLPNEDGKNSEILEKLSHGLSSYRARRWCVFEWFYSAIDYPWFARQEFVEYLDHVGLGHVPRLTRVEWGVIRSSLGKPRRFSEQFLKEEKEKLYLYRDSVRKHYDELNAGVREGLPTDLARPLKVGQRVIALHPRTREIYDGSVLTVDHSRYRVQFDQPDLGVEFVKDTECMPLNPLQNMPASLARQYISLNHHVHHPSVLKMQELERENMPEGYLKLSSETLENSSGPHLSPQNYNISHSLKHQKVDISSSNSQAQVVMDEAIQSPFVNSQPSTTAQNQAREADVQALSELTRVLDKKELVLSALKCMNNEIVESQKDTNKDLKDSESFKKQYAAVLFQLSEINEQVSLALLRLRQRNTYQANSSYMPFRGMSSSGDPDGHLTCLDNSVSDTHENEPHVSEIVESSRIKARNMVSRAMEAMTSLKKEKNNVVDIEEAIDFVNDQLSVDHVQAPVQQPQDCQDQSLASAPNPAAASHALDSHSKPLNKNDTQIPSELVTRCVATLLMIQKCTERQFPPSQVAEVLDSAVVSLQPSCSQNLPIYAEIQKCMGIIRNQILALVPT